MSHIEGPRPGAGLRAIARAQQKQKLDKLNQRQLRQTISKGAFREWCSKGYFDNVSRKFKTLDEFQEKDKAMREKHASEKAHRVTGKSEEAANEFTQRNPELLKDSLLELASSIKDDDTIDEILRKLQELFPDHTLAFDALDYLLETSKGDRLIKMQQAKEEFLRRYKRQIIAGKNIYVQANEYSAVGIGSPTELRDIYRDVTGKRRSPHDLFTELTRKFNYDQMKYVILFLLHALGSDLNSKGPSIQKAELVQLVDDTKTLQAILGVYRFFMSRIPLILSYFESNSLMLPPMVTFETLSKNFMNLINERFVSPDKILRLASNFQISNDPMAQEIIFMQFRDAIRNVAPKLYKSQKHKEEILLSIIEALEKIEEEEEE